MTAPIYIMPLFELYCSPAKENHYWLEREYGIDVKKELLDMELIRFRQTSPPETLSYEPSEHELTERGKFYIEALHEMPLPERHWRIPSHD